MISFSVQLYARNFSNRAAAAVLGLFPVSMVVGSSNVKKQLLRGQAQLEACRRLVYTTVSGSLQRQIQQTKNIILNNLFPKTGTNL